MDTLNTYRDPFLGKIIRGYRLVQLLGRGSATAVYRAQTEELWQVTELIVTILLVPEHLSSRAKERFGMRFEKIARRLTSLRHPFLFPLYGYGQQEGIYYLLAPDMQGETLAHHIQKHKRFTPSEILPIFTPIATALSYVHQQGLVYQFLQPANILLVNSTTVQVTGLGLAQLLCLHELEDEPTPYSYLKNFMGVFMGAPHYLAPEVVKKGEVNPRSDVYSLGILLYEMLSNQSPFSGNDYMTIAQKHVREPLPSFHAAAPDLPVALELIINRALHRTPEQRFQSPDELVAAYAHVLDERLHGPRLFNVVQVVEKIRALPMPTPHLQLSTPVQEQQTHPAWMHNPDAVAERQQTAQSHATPEDGSRYPVETFSSLLADEQKQKMRFVEQDEFPAQGYIPHQIVLEDRSTYQEVLSMPETWVASDVEFIPTTRLEPPTAFDASTWSETSPGNVPLPEPMKAQQDVKVTSMYVDNKLAQSTQLPVHQEMQKMALQLQQMKERLKAQTHKEGSTDIPTTPTLSTD